MNRILVIGGSSTVGRQVVSQLQAKGVHVRALARSPDAAALPARVEVVRGDLTVVGIFAADGRHFWGSTFEPAMSCLAVSQGWHRRDRRG